jgi:carbamoyltransferase
MKYIVGINLPLRAMCHEAGVALIDEEGKILFAASEERFTRKKLDGDFPEQSLRAMFSYSGIKPEDVEVVAIPSLHPIRKLFRFAEFLCVEKLGLLRKPATWFLLGKIFVSHLSKPKVKQGQNNINQEQSSATLKYHYQDFINKHFPKAKIAWVDHHLAHAASAYYTSPWSEALIATFDGAGNMLSSVIAEGKGGKIKIVSKSFIPHSLGSFWGSVTRICGFKSGTRHGGKVTGLAAYGDPQKLIGKMREVIRADGLKVKAREDLFFNPEILIPDWGSYEPERLKNFLGETSREDVSAAAQMRLEEVVSEIISNARKIIPHNKVVLAGGVCANVKMNQRIMDLIEVDDVYIHPAMSDGGLALGAALQVLSQKRTLLPQSFDTAYLGPDFSEEVMEKALRHARVKYQKMDHPAHKIASLIHDNKVVGLFQGRMEYGPRALGNRSILYSPIDPEVNNWLNKRLNRSEFMPFAPVTKIEKIKDNYVGIDSDPVASRYMTVTYDCTDKMKKDAPACVHIDGTARPQVVSRERNAYYYDIIDEYEKLSGIPTVINTSFNMHEEPIVCTPEDAIRAFLDSGIDYLVVGPFLASIEENRSNE